MDVESSFEGKAAHEQRMDFTWMAINGQVPVSPPWQQPRRLSLWSVHTRFYFSRRASFSGLTLTRHDLHRTKLNLHTRYSGHPNPTSTCSEHAVSFGMNGLRKCICALCTTCSGSVFCGIAQFSFPLPGLQVPQAVVHRARSWAHSKFHRRLAKCHALLNTMDFSMNGTEHMRVGTSFRLQTTTRC